MSRSRSAQPSTNQHTNMDGGKTRNPQNLKALATNQVTYEENEIYSKDQSSLVPQFPVGFIHVQLGLDKTKRNQIPKSNQTMRQKRKRQINSHLPNPNNLMVLQVPQNHSNSLQVPGQNVSTKTGPQSKNQQLDKMADLQPQKVQVRPKERTYSYVIQDQPDFLAQSSIEANKVEKYLEERQKKSEKTTLKSQKQGRLQNSGLYLISVSETMQDNKGMDKARYLSNNTRDTHHESSSIIVSEAAYGSKHKAMHTPPSIGAITSYNFKRQKVFWRSFVNPEYTLHTKDGDLVIKAKKQYAHFNSYYSISASKKEYSDKNQGYLGYMQGNFTGSQFNLYQQKDDQHQLMATIYYVSEFSCSSSYRSIEIYLRHPLLNSLGNEKGSLRDLYSQEQNDSSRSIIRLVNKQPEWSPNISCYIMNFHGKSKFGSTKNTILVQEGNPLQEVMLFCKTGQHDFLLEMAYPLTPFVAMGVILSSFDFKLCCE